VALKSRLHISREDDTSHHHRGGRALLAGLNARSVRVGVLLAPPVCTPSTRFIVKIRNSALRAGSATAASRSAAPGTAIASRAIISTPGGNVRHTLMGLLVAVVAATPVAAQDKAAAHGEKVYAA
jgi:hypothetical protein